MFRLRMRGSLPHLVALVTAAAVWFRVDRSKFIDHRKKTCEDANFEKFKIAIQAMSEINRAPFPLDTDIG